MTIRILSRALSHKFIYLQKKPISISCKRLIGNYVWQEKSLAVQDLKKLEEKWKHVTINHVKSASGCKLRTNGKKYILPMFPYPSGNLHMGHVRVYTISDAFARFYRLNGYEVIHPMGWDAFGLPAENAAFEKGVNPVDWTRNNIESMKEQLQEFGCKFDWERELSTCDPAYYKWTQFIFLKLLQHGLAYKQEAEVNWDPVDQTVLANEQVDANGFAWRSGAKVEKKILSQWYLKSTVLSQELSEDLDDPAFQNWREVSAIQKSWIGDLNGYIIEMKIVNSENRTPIKSIDHISVIMTHPEYFESVAFLGIKSSNILNRNQFKDPNNPSRVLNIKAVDPISNRLIPIIVNDDLTEDEMEFYTGIPHLKDNDKKLCHDLGIPVPFPVPSDPDFVKREEIVTKLKELNHGGYKCSSKLKDWLISRQRYWGTPIPIIYCDTCGIVPVPEQELPVRLPDAQNQVKRGDLILKNDEEWRQCSCPRCGKSAQRETDTMDTFVDSSWYYIRYLDPKNHSHLVDIEKAKNYLPVDLYIGGIEHALLHLYFSRFIHKFLTRVGLAMYKEPFTQLLAQGVVKSESYQVKNSGKYLRKEDVDFSVSPPVEKETRLPLIIKPEKMSKSKHNGVNPKDLLDEFGVDTLRLTILTVSSPQSTLNWNTADMNTYHDVFWKIWKATKVFVETRQDETFPSKAVRYANEIKDNEDKTLLFETRNKITLKVNHAFETRHLHMIVENIQQLINVFWSVRKHIILSDEYEKCIRCSLLFLAPFCPHFTAELWQRVNEVSSLPKEQQAEYIFDARWPLVDPTYERVLICKVNDTEICSIRIPKEEYDSLTHEKVVALAYDNEKVSSLLKASSILEDEFKHHPKYISTLSFMTKSEQEIGYAKRESKRQKKKAKLEGKL